MRMKQITAPNMQEALHIARRDLGDDAVLLETRKIAGGKGVTVVFAIDDADDFVMEDLADERPVHPRGRGFGEGVAVQSAAHGASSASPILSPRAAEVNRMAPPAIKTSPARNAARTAPFKPIPASPAPVTPPPPARATRTSVMDILAHALDSHLAPPNVRDCVLELAQGVAIPSGVSDGLDAAETVLAEALMRAFSYQPIRTADKNYPDKALMLVGPHGAGKSATIAKLATQLVVNKRKLLVISTDTEHMGANDTLHTLSGILKCDFRVIDKRAELRETIKSALGKAFILVDSAGVNIYEFAAMKALGELAGLQDVEPILTFPAGMDAAEAQEMAGVFNFLPVERMLLTRLDATRRLSSFFAVLATSGYAMANMTQSAKPSDACTPLSAPALARLMLRRLREHTAS